MRISPFFRFSLRSFTAFPAFLACMGVVGAQTPRFVDATLQAGLLREQGDVAQVGNQEMYYMTGGAAAGDYDGDGWVDLYVTCVTGSDTLYKNLGNDSNGSHLGFVDVTQQAFGGPGNATATNGCAWGDIDEDGDLDLYVTSILSQRYHLYINDGRGHFTEEGLARGAAMDTNFLHNGWSIAFGDYDHDGYLDLYAAEWGNSSISIPGVSSHSRLLKNLGSAQPGFFFDATDQANLGSVDSYPGQGVFGPMNGVFTFTPRFSDLDGDGWIDFALAGDFGTSRLFWNNGDGTFTDGTATAGVGTDQNGMGFALGDFTGDGLFDIFITAIYDTDNLCMNSGCNWGGTGNRLFVNDGGRTFTDRTDVAGVRDGGWGWGSTGFDYDNDGDLDLVMTNGVDFPTTSIDTPYATDRMRMWRNDPTGFVEIGEEVGMRDLRSGKGLLSFDYDCDGDVDILVIHNLETPRLFRNEGGNQNSWLRINLKGEASNTFGVGARITVTPESGGASQVREVSASSNFLGQDELTVHFGLGPVLRRVAEVEVRWPSGSVSTYTNVPGNQTLTLSE